MNGKRMKKDRRLLAKINLPTANAKYLKHWPASLAVGMVFLLGPAYGEDIQKENSVAATESLEQRGKQLRVELDQAYKKMVDAKTLSPDPRVSNDVTDVVVRFIPVGTSFDDAENILRSAGFKDRPRPSANSTGTRPDRYDVVASIVPFVQRFLSKASIYVYLRPAAPDDYGKVSKVGAEFVLSYL